MIRIVLEMVPFGDERRKRRIGVAEISNVGGSREAGDYSVRIFEDGKPPVSGRVEGFLRAKGAWALVAEALSAEKGQMSKTIEELSAAMGTAYDSMAMADQEHSKAKNALCSALAKIHGVRRVDLGFWECPDSPRGMCYYDDFEDPCHDSCLVCGQPAERK